MKKLIKTLKKKLNNFNPKLKEECGVFGISDTKDAAALTALGLHALQHRGQEGCGIVSFDGSHYFSEKRFGLVGDNFNKEKILSRLRGNYAIGHNRYSTTGENTLRNLQPFFADTNAGGIGVAHNGNLTNSISLRKKLVDEGAIFYTTSDTETIVQLIARSKRKKTIDKIVDAVFQIQGGYSLVMLTQTSLIGVRDPYGIRPLVIGKLNNSYVLSSETCALDIIGAKFVREVDNGEIVLIEDNKIKSIKPFPTRKIRPCVFEYIYFSRPDSILSGKSAYEHRKNLGKELAKENDLKADIVVPVPDSGNAAALGFAQYLDINFELGLTRNHYVGRTFIEPIQKIRSLGVKLKLNANQSTIKNKKIILVSFTFALFGFLIGIVSKDFEQMSIIPSLVITPMVFLGGSLYSLDMLPEFWQMITYFNPVVYLINGLRYSFYGISDFNIWLSVGLMVLFLTICIFTVSALLKKGYNIKN